MTLVFIDTEFTSFSHRQLISLGAVAEDREFYVEISDFDREEASPFVQETVIPQLNLALHGKPRKQAAHAFAAWLAELQTPTLVCDHGVDTEVLEGFVADGLLFNTLILPHMQMDKMLELADKQLPEDFYGDYEALISRSKDEYLEKNPSAQVHHALTDAKINQFRHKSFEAWIAPSLQPSAK